MLWFGIASSVLLGGTAWAELWIWLRDRHNAALDQQPVDLDQADHPSGQTGEL